MTKVAISYMIKNEADLIKQNIEFHKRLGVEHFFVFLDENTDNTEETLKDLANITVKKSLEPDELNDSFIDNKFLPLRDSHNARRVYNSLYAARQAKEMGFDWLICIDADELILCDFNDINKAQINSTLEKIDPSINQVIFNTYEQVPKFKETCSSFFGANEFIKASSKPLARKLYDPLSKTYIPFNRNFMGHDSGKTAFRLSALEDYYPLTHRWLRRSDDQPGETTSIDSLVHYYFYSFKHFRQRFINYKDRDDWSIANYKYPDHILKLIELVQEMSEEEFEDYYKNYICKESETLPPKARIKIPLVKEEITILIAADENSPYIERAIKSVKEQSNPNWKLLISKNGSNISTLEKLISEAETEIVGILHPDDALAKNAVELALAAYEKNPEIAFTYSDSYRCGSKLIPQGIIKSKQVDRLNSHLLKDCINPFRTFKKSAYYAAGAYDEKYTYAEDHDLSYKLEENFQGLYIEEPLYFLRAVPSSPLRDPIKKERALLSQIQAMIAAIERRKGTELASLNEEELRERISELRFRPSKPILSFKNKPFRYIRVCLNFAIFDPLDKFFSKLFGSGYTKLRSFVQDYFYLLKDIRSLLLLNLTSENQDKKPNKPLSINSILCQSKKFAFVSIPKNASSYLASLTIENDWGYPRELSQKMIHRLTGFNTDGKLRIKASEMKNLDDSFLKFAVYRDPVERALSFYKEKIYNRGSSQYMAIIDAIDHPGTSFDKFIQYLKDNSKNFSTEHTDPHIIPQALCLKDSSIDYLVPIEKLNSFLEEKRGISPQPAQNKSYRESKNFMDTIKQEDIDIIKNIYSDDYQLLEIYKDKIFSEMAKEEVK